MPTEADGLVASLESIDRKLTGLLALLADGVASGQAGAARRPRRPVEVILHQAGLSDAQISDLLGKSRQAVQQARTRHD